jgi:exonuclease III
MKIVSWNCRNGFSEPKQKIISYYDADILVVQECKKEEWKKIYPPDDSHSVWYGEDKDNVRGVGVFSKDKYKIQRFDDSEFNKGFRYVVPYRVNDGKKPFILFVVWMTESNGKDGYHDHLFKALEYYKTDAKIPQLFIGDFNTGANSKNTWYTNLETHLNAKQLFNCAKGNDQKELTFFGHQGHVIDDFCFASAEIANNANCKVIDTLEFKSLSDHCPIIVDFDW